MKEAGFSLGSNLGDRLALLRAARDRLAALPGARLVAQSPVYETAPVGVRPEYEHLWFLNAVIVVEAERDAAAWMPEIARIEAELGRVRTEDRYAPRPIDIDLIYCGTDFVDAGGIQVPHPRWMQRAFVVRPLADVRPHLRLAGASATVSGLLRSLGDAAEKVRLFAQTW